MIRRPLAPGVAAAALLLAAAAVPAQGQDADAASRARIEALTAEERAALRDRHEAFLDLPEAERERLRSLHARLEADGPAGDLNQTLDRLRAVLVRLTPAERAAVESADTPAERVVLLRRVIDGYRSIPPPPEGFSDFFNRAPGERSAADWPRVDLIEEELIVLLAERSSLSRLTGDDPLAAPRPERLFRVLESAATTRGSLRPRPPEEWLPDTLLTELDARLTARGLPGLDRWLGGTGPGGEFAAQFARGQLVGILSRALRKAWTERVGGPNGERLLPLLTSLPDRDAVRAAGGAAREELAERLVRSPPEGPDETVAGLSEEEREAAVRAFELADRLRDLSFGSRRFGRRGNGDRRPPDRRPEERGDGPPNGNGRPEEGGPPNRPSFRSNR
ncbi:hypothetical protein [Alienimonas californiensis]|uniref:LTXXQ motif protein n=1 Tax=Alienimonas californiensis TaxID=2527989 RepID=A0A517PDM5_9PLAN|nr:hypothetical protein [Alienimonas californiensis]QDT17466.1 hypothetical protein CA12_35910 [Alienimonas californiensis]